MARGRAHGSFTEADVVPAREQLDSVTTVAAELQTKMKLSKHWTKDNVDIEARVVDELVAKLAKGDAGVLRELSELEARARQARVDAARARKAETAVQRRRSKPWTGLGLPQVWAALLADVGLLVVDDRESAMVPESLGQDSLQDTDPDQAYVPTLLSVKSNTVDWQRPLLLNPAVAGSLQGVDLGTVCDLVQNGDMRVRVSEATKKLNQYMMTASAPTLGVVRMGTKEPGSDFDSLDWLPQLLRGAEGTDTFAAPWLCCMRPHAIRARLLEFPAVGLSHFAVVVAGSMAVLAWELRHTEDLAVSVEQAHLWLMQLSCGEAVGRVDSKVILHCKADAGEVLWIPNGWACAWINRGAVRCDTAYIPVLNTRRAVRELREDVRRGVRRAGGRFVAANSAIHNQWKDALGPAFQGWLQVLERTTDTEGSAAAAAVPPSSAAAASTGTG